MSLCKDCIHDEVCTALYELNGVPKVGGSTHCGYFRSKELNVQFPFKPGDSVYFRRECDNEIVEGKVYGIHGTAFGRPASWDAAIWIDEYYGSESDLGRDAGTNFCMPINDFNKPLGKRSFKIALTKEEFNDER